MVILKLYRNIVRRHSWTVPAFQAGSLMATGDLIAQVVVERKDWHDISVQRTARFAFIGFAICGPGLRFWYSHLDRHLGSSGKSALKKVFLDQVVFAPFFLGLMLGSIGIVQGNSPRQVQQRLKEDYIDVLLNNYKLWPAVQLCNFYITPLKYQVLVVQIVAVFWNTYISWKSNQEIKHPLKNSSC